MLFGFSRYFYGLLFFGSVFLVYGLCRRFGFSFVGFLFVFLLVFDTVYFNTFRFLLLDPVAVFFSILGIYLFFVGRFSFSAISMGLAVASKFSSIPIFIGVLCYVYRCRRFRGVLVYLLIALAVYLLTYVADFSLGLYAVVKHHVDMFSYMFWRHSFSLPIALNGFLKLLTRVEFWRYVGDIHIVLSGVPNGYSVVNQTFIPMDMGYVVVGVGLGSFLWYLLFPALLYSTYLVLVKQSDSHINVFVLFSWLSMLNIVAGPIDWYYANVLPYLYLNLCFVLQRVLGYKFKFVAVALAVAQVSTFLATALGFIQFKLVFVK